MTEKVTVPARIGAYNVVKPLGRGTTGTVYLCRDTEHKRDVAIKLFMDDAEHNERQREVRRKLFFNEAQLAGRLHHPNILPIYDVGEQSGQNYLVMEYIEGAEPLSRHCRTDRLLPVRKLVEVLFKCARAMDYAHRKGIVHRDLKPGNILLNADGDVRLLDFGIAVGRGDEDLSPSKGLVGSPSYMAPEQLRDEPASIASDIYSLGVVGYELLTGKRPYYGENLSKLAHQIVYATPTPMHKLRPEVPPLLEQIIGKAMHKKADKRYSSGLELSIDLTRVFAELDRLKVEAESRERFNQLRRLDFFGDFSYPEVWELLGVANWQTHRDGAVMAAEGRKDGAFCILVSGKAAILRSNRRVGELRAGACFGEAGLVAGQAQTSTIIARGEVQIVQMNAARLDELSERTQLRFYRAFLTNLLKRLAAGGPIRKK